MIIPRFEVCPICSRVGHNNVWRETNHNPIWWERICSNYHHRCSFSQFYWDSFENPTLNYIRFGLKDFFCYTYAEATTNLFIIAGTYFYHNKFPRGEAVQEPFQIWPNFIPDWDNLDKLNNKLNLYKTFK